MKKIDITDPSVQTGNPVGESISQLQKLFPEAFSEGKIDFEVLKQLLGGEVDDSDERFGLNWHGKKRARQIALTPSTGTLRPCPEESVDWDTTQNLMIEGDNLEVLKLLQKSYAGKVKMIYIDPPYNTGKDFVYPDNFQDSIANYKVITGQMDDEGLRVSTNTETSGRYHTDWLNMMYPRLKLARNLLRDDGVIIVHIDENEYVRLESILSDIFGEDNNLGTIVWDKRNPKGDATGVSQQHEYVSVYCKSKDRFIQIDSLKRPKENAERIISKANGLISENNGVVDDLVRRKFKKWISNQPFSEGEKAYCNIDSNGVVYRPVSMAWPNKKQAPKDYFKPLLHPITGLPCPVPERGWRNPPLTMERLIKDGMVIFGKDETTQPTRKYLLHENMYENVPSLMYYAGSDDALLSLMNIPFDTPKSVDVSKRLITTCGGKDELIMDFFAGSGTTGHAVMQQNAEDDGHRRYILVQLPEPVDNKQYSTIAGVTKERLRRAGQKIKSENPDWQGDTGFRVFKLDSSNIRPWQADPDNLELMLDAHVSSVIDGRSEADLETELMLRRGVMLSESLQTREVAGLQLRCAGNGILFSCLAPRIPESAVEPLADAIADWHKALNADKNSACYFLDSAFDSNVAKANLSALLKQHGLSNVFSL